MLADLDECGKVLCKVGMPLQPLLAPCRDVLRQLHSLDPAMLHLQVSRSSKLIIREICMPLQLLLLLCIALLHHEKLIDLFETLTEISTHHPRDSISTRTGSSIGQGSDRR